MWLKASSPSSASSENCLESIVIVDSTDPQSSSLRSVREHETKPMGRTTISSADIEHLFVVYTKHLHEYARCLAPERDAEAIAQRLHHGLDACGCMAATTEHADDGP